jgi:hypothetical protein
VCYPSCSPGLVSLTDSRRLLLPPFIHPYICNIHCPTVPCNRSSFFLTINPKSIILYTSEQSNILQGDTK